MRKTSIIIAVLAAAMLPAQASAGELAQPGIVITNAVGVTYTTTGDEWVEHEAHDSQPLVQAPRYIERFYSPRGTVAFRTRTTGDWARFGVFPTWSKPWTLEAPRDLTKIPGDRCSVVSDRDESWKIRTRAGIPCNVATKVMRKYLHNEHSPHGWRCKYIRAGATCWVRGHRYVAFVQAIEVSAQQIAQERVKRSREVADCGNATALSSRYPVVAKAGDTASCSAFASVAGRIAGHIYIYGSAPYAIDEWACGTTDNGTHCASSTGCVLIGAGGPAVHAIAADGQGWFTYLKIGNHPCS